MKLFRICALLLVGLLSVNYTACGGGTKTDVVTENFHNDSGAGTAGFG